MAAIKGANVYRSRLPLKVENIIVKLNGQRLRAVPPTVMYI